MRHFLTILTLATLLLAHPARAEDLAQRDGWRAVAADGVAASVQRDSHGLRLDFEFQTGAGFCILRLDLDRQLPERFEVSMDVRSGSPPNDLELKLLMPETDAGQDVWWHNRRAFRFPTDWTTLRSKRRHFEHAWGPSGGEAPLDQLAAIELAIAAGEGGKGSLWIRDLTITELPPLEPFSGFCLVRTSDAPRRVARFAEADWAGHEVSIDHDVTWVDIDYSVTRPIDALTLAWRDTGDPRSYTLELHRGDGAEPTIVQAEDRRGERDWFFVPDSEVRRIRVVPIQDASLLRGVEVHPAGTVPDINAFVQRMAAEAPPGRFPKHISGRQSFWTVVGAPDSDLEATISETGTIETRRGGHTYEPFLRVGHRVFSWADAEITCRLVDGYLPIPIVRWEVEDLVLEIAAIANDGPKGEEFVWRYRVLENVRREEPVSLLVVARPFQNLPPWQRLNLTGGFSPITSAEHGPQRLVINRTSVLQLGRSMGFFSTARIGLSALDDGSQRFDLFHPYRKMETLKTTDGLGSAAINVELNITTLEDVIARTDPTSLAWSRDDETLTPGGFQLLLEQRAREWRPLLNRVEFLGPPAAMRAWDVVRSNLAYILINADGPALQPGSRTYERSWIRDGAVTGATLLSLGHAERVREFIEWYAPNQFENGKVPCVVDRRGPDPVDEHDSTGQLIYLLRRHAETTSDHTLIRKHFHRVEKGIAYLQSLRDQRMVAPYSDPASPEHAKFGLVTESISHEGYSAKPMHSYWDNFWVLRGIKDAIWIADQLGEADRATEWRTLETEFRGHLYDSIRLAAAQTGVDYIPGCVELGDFDATSTATAIMPGGELDHLPQPLLDNTFDKWWAHAKGRIDDTVEWFDYTPYEARIIGALVMMGQPERAHALMDWLFEDLLPPGWNHWAEVAYRDDHHPGWIGDMPHTWVGAGFINSFLTMLAYERESDEALVVAAGVPFEWLGWPIQLEGLRTAYGEFGYALSMDIETGGIKLILAPGDDFRVPPGGIVFSVPGDLPIEEVRVMGEIVEPVGRDVVIREAPGHVVVRLGRE